MTRAKQQGKKVRKQYSEEYKRGGALAERVGIAAAASRLGVPESQFYGWRAKVRREENQGEAQRQLAAENARLKRQLAIRPRSWR